MIQGLNALERKLENLASREGNNIHKGASDTATGPEARFCASTAYNNAACIASYKQQDKEIAIAASEKYFPPPKDVTPGTETIDNRTDAARHCIWSGLMTHTAGPNFARGLADTHEAGGNPGGHPWSEQMDNWNNETGRQVGMKHSKYDSVKEDRQAIIRDCVELTRNATLVTDESQLANPDGETIVILVDNTTESTR